jgi:superoxide dismutase, Fe-Mn family
MFTLPDLPYPADALEPFIDTQTMEIHHGKHHAAYVKNINDLLPDKSETDLEAILSGNYDQKIKNNAGGHYNHSLFWNYMTPQKTSPSSQFMSLVSKDFASLDGLKEKFLGTALTHFGSGWAWVILKNGSLSIVTTPNQDSPITNNLQPILGVDVWEHAYYLKYQNRRAEYLQAWWNVVNWSAVTV